MRTAEKELKDMADQLPAEYDKLTPKEQEVVELFTVKGMNITAIAKQLNCTKSNVHKHLNKPTVKEVVLSHVRSSIALGSVQAAKTLNRLSSSAKSEFVQLEASKALLDRAGVSQPERNNPALAIQINLNTN